MSDTLAILPPAISPSARPRRTRATAVFLAGTLMLSACATSGGGSTASTSCSPSDPNLTPAERQMCQDAATFNETIAGGAMTGALAGAAIGALAGLLTGDGKAVAQGALIGAAAGGIMGGIDGYITAKAQENSNNRVRMLNSMAEDVEQDNAKLQSLVASSNRVLADSRNRLNKLNADYKVGKASLDQIETERKRLEANRARLETWVSDVRTKRDKYVQASLQMKKSGGGSTKQLDAEIAKMNQEIAQLESTINGMNTALQVQRT